MTVHLAVQSSGPANTIQDAGRPGYYRFGIAEGGVMDAYAYNAGLALLGDQLASRPACLELNGSGGRFVARQGDIHIALTGKSFAVKVDDRPVPWHSSRLLQRDQVLDIGASLEDGYGYLSVRGGFQVPKVLGSRSTHRRGGFGGFQGRSISSGDQLAVLPRHSDLTGYRLPVPDYFKQRVLRVVWGPQARYFSESERQRFLATRFTVSHQRDRMGCRLEFNGEPFESQLGLKGVSDSVCAGDIQLPGDGKPAVLLADRQPTGGYPRIATVISADIPAFVQLPAGTAISFELTTIQHAHELLKARQSAMASLVKQRIPLLRDPADVENLLTMQLISGVISGFESSPDKEVINPCKTNKPGQTT